MKPSIGEKAPVVMSSTSQACRSDNSKESPRQLRTCAARSFSQATILSTSVPPPWTGVLLPKFSLRFEALRIPEIASNAANGLQIARLAPVETPPKNLEMKPKDVGVLIATIISKMFGLDFRCRNQEVDFQKAAAPKMDQK
jgi:hypothetical protein